MDVRSALKNSIAKLRDANVASYTLAAELLLLHTLGRERTWLYTHPEAELSSAEQQTLFSLLARRIAGEPTQHLTGKQQFWGLEFEVNPDVLIPRPETEHLIEVALDRLALREIRAGRPQLSNGADLRIADVGTGSGCIAIALAKEFPAATVHALDVSRPALEVAQRNATRHAVGDRVHFVESDLFSATPDYNFDLVVSNPPYIGRRTSSTLPREVRDREPAAALLGGEEGYELYADLIPQSAAHLAPTGILVLELGHDSLPAVEPLLDTRDWTRVGVSNDLAGIPRVIAAERR
jgi:release factor glutamine methyltransferase